MNKTYRRIFKTSFYRLNRSVKTRDLGRLFGCDFFEMPDYFFKVKNTKGIRWRRKRVCFNYRKNHVDTQIHLRKLDHGKFKTFKKGEITDDYRCNCRRDCGC